MPWVTVFQMSVLYNVPANQSLRKPSQKGDKKIKKTSTSTGADIYTQVDENYNTRNNSLAHFTIIIIIITIITITIIIIIIIITIIIIIITIIIIIIIIIITITIIIIIIIIIIITIIIIIAVKKRLYAIYK